MTDKDKFLAFLQNQLGKPYESGAEGPDKFDCSGLVYAGLTELTSQTIPRSSTEQYALGSPIEISDLKSGDLIFFDTGWTDRKPNHEGAIISSGRMINANTYYNAVSEESYNSTYWKEKIYGKGRRIFDSAGKLKLTGGGNGGSGGHFSDVSSSNSYFQYIEQLYNEGVITGYGDGTFKPNDTINRVEALKIILEALNIPVSSSFTALTFTDTDNNAWYAKYVAAGVKKGILNGYPDGTFKPDADINRAEMCKIIFKGGNNEPAQPQSSSYTDIKTDSWYCKYALKAIEWQMFVPVSSAVFGSSNPVKRGEMCRAICKFLENR